MGLVAHGDEHLAQCRAVDRSRAANAGPHHPDRVKALELFQIDDAAVVENAERPFHRTNAVVRFRFHHVKTPTTRWNPNSLKDAERGLSRERTCKIPVRGPTGYGSSNLPSRCARNSALRFVTIS